MKKEDYKKLKKKADLYRGILHDVACRMHAISSPNPDLDEPSWTHYMPSNFVYSFLLFNTLYDIDWECSCGLPKKMLKSYSTDDKEMYKIYQYINFVFSDDDFCKRYYEPFKKIITCSKSQNEITKALEDISINFPFRDKLTEGYDALFKDGKINRGTICGITEAIYKVRCNLFHGEKDLTRINSGRQKDRLEIYADFLIALNQSLFALFDFHDESVNDFCSESKELVSRIKMIKFAEVEDC